MNKRFVGVLTFAFLVAAGASLILYRVLLNRPQNAKAAPVAAHIVLANKNLDVGTVLKEEDVQVADWPGAVPEGSSMRTQDVVGRGVTTAIYAKEPVIESRLAPKGAGGGLAAMIPPGMRAVAVRVNEVVGVAGFVVPGMRVDVLISGNTPSGGTQGTLTRTLLQNVEVLSAGQDFKKDAEGKPVLVQVINLLVTPEAAEQLSLAANQTQIQLVLRNPLDRANVNTPGTTLQQIFSGRKVPLANVLGGSEEAAVRPRARPVQRAAVAPPAEMAPKKEPPFVMEIISGTKKVESKFVDNGEGK
ncbi:MAG: Flp pilus assembly protein CpaB [Acidobacteriota bacterium]|nr:Flp pilus assembly protein CpaB [Acidobacteriota bacterium]